MNLIKVKKVHLRLILGIDKDITNVEVRFAKAFKQVNFFVRVRKGIH